MSVPVEVQALLDVDREVTRQEEKWGKRSNPDIDVRFMFPLHYLEQYRDMAQTVCDRNIDPSWGDILIEEVFEALVDAENTNLRDLRAELVQVAAVCVSWIVDLDTRK